MLDTLLEEVLLGTCVGPMMPWTDPSSLRMLLMLLLKSVSDRNIILIPVFVPTSMTGFYVIHMFVSMSMEDKDFLYSDR